jgi:hypothetical protein
MMKDLTIVKNFYKNVEALEGFDFEALASKFASHDIFANPPVGIVANLPFLGEVELFLVAVALDTSKWLARSEIAVDDGEYSYSSRVVFLAKATPILEQAGYEIFQFGPFAGMVALSGGQGNHSNIFGHPAKYYYGDGKWALKSPGEFVTGNLRAIIKDAVKRFYPTELHEYPFDTETSVKVFVQDTNKIGGYTEISSAAAAMEVYHRLAAKIYEKESGNVNISGHIQAGNVRYVIPAFGNNYVAFIND